MFARLRVHSLQISCRFGRCDRVTQKALAAKATQSRRNGSKARAEPLIAHFGCIPNAPTDEGKEVEKGSGGLSRILVCALVQIARGNFLAKQSCDKWRERREHRCGRLLSIQVSGDRRLTQSQNKKTGCHGSGSVGHPEHHDPLHNSPVHTPHGIKIEDNAALLQSLRRNDR